MKAHMEITTARLTLRELTMDDYPDLLAYERDPRYQRFYPESWTDRSDTQVREFVQMQIDDRAETPRRKFQLAITLPDDGRLIGNCGIRRKDSNEFEADIGYELNPEHWGHGYATEAARAMVAFGFDELRLHRVSATGIADNVGSARVLEKAGLRREGVLRENEYFRGRWWDTFVYGVIEDEWRAH
jgi:RimJ/RimL family protein N-acetyltransferase